MLAEIGCGGPQPSSAAGAFPGSGVVIRDDILRTAKWISSHSYPRFRETERSGIRICRSILSFGRQTTGCRKQYPIEVAAQDKLDSEVQAYGFLKKCQGECRQTAKRPRRRKDPIAKTAADTQWPVPAPPALPTQRCRAWHHRAHRIVRPSNVAPST